MDIEELLAAPAAMTVAWLLAQRSICRSRIRHP
jgi:hypothetical protein